MNRNLKERATEELRDDVCIRRRSDSIKDCDVGMSELCKRIDFTEKCISLWGEDDERRKKRWGGNDVIWIGCFMFHFLDSNILSAIPFSFPNFSKESFANLVSQSDLR